MYIKGFSSVSRNMYLKFAYINIHYIYINTNTKSLTFMADKADMIIHLALYNDNVSYTILSLH